MTQIYNKEGIVVPVTVIEAGPCFITQIRTKEPNKDGYDAVQIGFQELKPQKIKKPLKQKPFKYLKEFRGDIDITKFKTGDKIDVSTFQEGDKIRISGISKGRGFQGVVKRYGFKGGSTSHGDPHSLRKPGSIGCSFPEKVIKGKRMAGHMGIDRITVKNLKIAAIDAENNLLAVSGAVPGPNGGLIEIQTI